MGYWTGHYFQKKGSLVTTIIESDSAIHSSKGINVKEAKEYFDKNGSFSGYKDADEVVTD